MGSTYNRARPQEAAVARQRHQHLFFPLAKIVGTGAQMQPKAQIQTWIVNRHHIVLCVAKFIDGARARDRIFPLRIEARRKVGTRFWHGYQERLPAGAMALTRKVDMSEDIASESCISPDSQRDETSANAAPGFSVSSS